MNINSLMINLVVVLFPILVNILHELYIKNSDSEKNKLFLDISLLSSLYLCMLLNKNVNYTIIFMCIIFLFSLLKRRIFTSFIICIFLIYNYKIDNLLYLSIISIQYIFYYAYYYVFLKNNMYKKFKIYFVVTKIIFIFIYYILVHKFILKSIESAILISIIFFIVYYLISYIVLISEDIVKLHMNIKDLEQEKQIRDSLFKITHEIKNPIAVCKSYLDMFDFNNKEHERYIPILKEEMDKILTLLQDFSSMSKIQIKKEILDVNLLLEETCRQLAPIITDDNIKFITNISDEELYIEGDYNRLSQVLTNIIKNSKEAKDINKESYIKVDTKLENNKFIIIISDNGVGISKEDMEKIKEPFYTTKKNGTGLGVSLSIEIINAHNGTIEFVSEQFVETRVTITLPILNSEF